MKHSSRAALHSIAFAAAFLPVVLSCSSSARQVAPIDTTTGGAQNSAQGADATGNAGNPSSVVAGSTQGALGATVAAVPILDTAAISKLIATDFAAQGSKGSQIIYATIDHLAPDKIENPKLEIVRFGMTKTLNSVSMAPAIAKLQAIDPARTVFRVNLADFNQAGALATIKSAPYAQQNVSQVGGATVVKGDWLVYALTRPEIYDPLMKLPAIDTMLESTLRVDYSKAGYINAQSSDVVFNGRVLMRVPIELGGKPGGYYWRSYDFARGDVMQRAFKDPSFLRSTTIPDLVAGEFFFSLPNGLQAYYLVGFGNQHRYDVPAPGGGSIDPPVATDYRRPQDGLHPCVGGKAVCGYVINGESCMTCHGDGINIPKNPAGTNGISMADMTNFMNQDRARFAGAIKEMGFTTVTDEPIFATLSIFRNDRKVADKRSQGSEVSGLTGK